MGSRRLVNVLGNHVSCEPGALHSVHISAWEGSSVSREAPDLRPFQRIILAGTQWQHPIRFRSHRGPTHIDHCGGSHTKVIPDLLSLPLEHSNLLTSPACLLHSHHSHPHKSTISVFFPVTLCFFHPNWELFYSLRFSSIRSRSLLHWKTGFPI